MSKETSKPIETIRDGRVSASIWRNVGEKSAFYTVTFERVYTAGDGSLKNASSFSGSELLKLSRLVDLAYGRILELRAADQDKGQADQAA